MKLIQNMVNAKINAITADELLKYAGQYQIQLSKAEADYIAGYLRGKNFDVFNDQTRAQLVREAAKIIGPEKARELNKMFLQFTS